MSRLAIAVLALVLAGLFPALAHAQAADPPSDVLFILDSSASMSRDDARGKASDPQGLRLSAVRAFITLATPRMRMGLLNLSDSYSGNDGLDSPTPLQTGLVLGLTDASPAGKARMVAAANEMKTTHEAELEDGYTYMTKALDLAQRVMSSSRAPQRYVIVLTDGDVTGEDPRLWWKNAADLKTAGINLVIFRLGRREPPGLTNAELTDLNASLAPGGGARVVETPRDLLSYYLQTFVQLSRDTYVNGVGPMVKGDDRPLLQVHDWMDVTEVHILVPPATTTEAGPLVTRLTSDRLGRDVVREARGDLPPDSNLEVLSLTRERLGPLEGLWRISLGANATDVQVVFRSRIQMTSDVILQPKGTENAVVALQVTDGGRPIPSKTVMARGAPGEEPKPLLLGALAADRYSGVVAPDRDNLFRARVGSGQAVAAAGDLPPRIEKAFAIGTTDRIGVDDVALAFERIGGDKILPAGQPMQIRVTGQAGRCQVTAAALKVDAVYPRPPAGLPGRETLAAQAMGAAPNGGLLYGFVPQAPAQSTFAMDHGVVRCPELPQLVGVPAGARATAPQRFDLDVERRLDLTRDTPAALGTLPAGADGVDVSVKFELASWRPEQIVFGVRGGAAAVTQPQVELPARDGAGRPRPRAGALSVRVKFPGPQPGGANGAFTLTAQRIEETGALTEIGAYDFRFDVAPSLVSVGVSRDPQLTREGVNLTIGLNPSRMAFIPPANGQDFELAAVGLRTARIEPKTVRAIPGRELVEHRIFIQTSDFCEQPGPFQLGLSLAPAPSPNGVVQVAGSPVRVAIPLPKMELTLAAPERIGALRPGTTFPITLQSTSLCPEALTLRLSEPGQPERFADSGLSAPAFHLPAGEGEVRGVQIVPTQPAPRGEGGVLRLDAARQSGHPATVQPAGQTLRYYTPLWTEEFPTQARIAFGAIALGLTLLFSLPRTMIADPLLAHRAGDSSIVSGRKRFRWFLACAILSIVLSLAIVYWAMARYLP